MEYISLKDAMCIMKLSYQTIFNIKSQLGFFRINNKGKWLANKKVFEEKLESLNNKSRLTSIKEVKCQSKNVVNSGILISNRQTANELGDLLARQKKERPKSIMTS